MSHLIRHWFRPSLCMLLLLLAHGAIRADDASEASVKVAFIFNFFKFIEWPTETAKREQFVLCANGENAISEGLQLLEGKTIDGKPLTVRLHVQGEALRACHIVYLAEPRATLLRDLHAYPVVTVADNGDFMQQGGMINLVADEDRLSFEVNLEPAQAVGVRISARLLKLAKSVRGGKITSE